MLTWNAMTVARAYRAGAAGLALVILSTSLAAAGYGPRTKLGDNYQQWSDVTSTNALAPGPCNNTTNCYVLFQAIPQNRPLIVEHVGCRVIKSNGSLRSAHLRTRKGQTFPFRWTPLKPRTATAAARVAINSPVKHLLKSGERPFFWFVGTVATQWAIDCSISGTLQ
jgi:hypothetical protein